MAAQGHRELSGGEDSAERRFRGLHALRRYPNGEERCIACKLCEAVCPALASPSIRREQRRHPPHHTLRHRPVQIHLLRLLRGGLPGRCHRETRIHEYHMEHRGENIMNKDKLLGVGERYEAMIAADRAADARYR